VTVTPYIQGQDILSVLENDNDRYIKANFSAESGALTFTNVGGLDLTKDDWDRVLNFPTYQLYINNFSPRSCSSFTHGRYTRKFTIQMVDRYGRRSNVVTRNMKVKTAVLMYTSARPVTVTNAAAFTSLEIKQNSLDPLYDLINATAV